MTDTGPRGVSGKEAKDAQWPFVFLYCTMWAGMIGMSLNNDPIKLDLNFPVIFGLIAILGIVIFIAASRYFGARPSPSHTQRFRGTLLGTSSFSPASFS